MRDYKNVKVPRKYRTATNRVTVKRVTATRGSGTRSVKSGSALLKILAIAAIAVGSYLGWQTYRVLANADIFQVSGVDVKGVKHLSEKDLKDIAGVFTGQNIFRVELDAAGRKARAHPWIKDVRIYRSLPNRISMAITERTPFAVLDTGKAQYLLDAEGVALERIAKDGAEARRLPRITTKELHAVPGEQITAGGVVSALELLAEISERGGWSLSAVTIKADSPENLTVVYAQSEFKVGTGNYAEKFRRAAEVMSDLKQRGVSPAYVDLRPERQVAVMVEKNGVQGPGSKGKGKRL